MLARKPDGFCCSEISKLDVAPQTLFLGLEISPLLQTSDLEPWSESSFHLMNMLARKPDGFRW
jgi:hypothetical protein